jgi:sirohydrochlorin ferrochelatase
MRTGIVVFGHGSSVASANDAVRIVAAEAARQGAWELYETAFLEALPRLDDAVSKLAAAGADRVLVLPYFLTLGIHLQRDLPLLVDGLSHKHGIAIRVAPPLDEHPALSRILVDRASEMFA